MVTIERILARAAGGSELAADEAALLFTAEGAALDDLIRVADEVRQRRVGNTVAYVVNRNINFTNVCVKRCGFCAFSRGHRAGEGYFYSIEEVVRRARQAWECGATEVCVQAGLAPRVSGAYYVELCGAIRRELPGLHLHAFSPEEVRHGASLAGCEVEDYLARLRDAGLGSMPGTAAEILDDTVRETISPGRITTANWVRVIRAAHRLNIPTSSTMMFGHIETRAQMAHHLLLLRRLQLETGGFTEFVPLSFIHHQAPMYVRQLVPGLRPGAAADEIRRVYAVARLVLQGAIDNIQVSWVKQGPQFAAECLRAGANDFGGTLMNESISTAAGARHGQGLTPFEMRTWIRAAGRVPAERSTVYKILKAFKTEPEQEITPALPAPGSSGDFAAPTVAAPQADGWR